MCRRKTNCIQNNLTESSNKIIFGINIRARFRYIDYLDIFMFIHIKSKSFRPRRTQLKPH